MRRREQVSESVSDAVRDVGALRDQVKGLKANVAESTLKVSQLHRRQKNILKLKELLEHMKDVRSVRAVVQGLMSVQDFIGALLAINAAQRVLTNGGPLEGMVAFKQLAQQLEKFKRLIGDTMEESFVQVAVTWEVVGGDSEYEYTTTEEETTQAQAQAQAQSSTLNLEKKNLEDRMMSLIRGLLKTEQMPGAMTKYKERVEDEVKRAIKTVVSDTLLESEADVSAAGHAEEESASTSAPPPQTATAAEDKASSMEESAAASLQHAGAAPSTDGEESGNVRRLLDMGFPAEWCYEALEQNHEDVEAAAEWLLSRSDEILKSSTTSSVATAPPPAPKPKAKPKPTPTPRLKSATSSEDIGTKLRSLSPEAFENCIALIFEHLLELLNQGKALKV
jgi:hypothetical protein